jgi:hypothetical protein
VPCRRLAGGIPPRSRRTNKKQRPYLDERVGTRPLEIEGLEQFLAGGVVLCRPVLEQRVEPLAFSTVVSVGELVEETGCSP